MRKGNGEKGEKGGRREEWKGKGIITLGPSDFVEAVADVLFAEGLADEVAAGRGDVVVFFACFPFHRVSQFFSRTACDWEDSSHVQQKESHRKS